MDFETRFAKLNNNQKQAAEHVHGPLLVLAGPGTGKTELLSMRAANILKQTDTLASNILCLTFTDSAAVNMRQRLSGIIGEQAYKTAIHTFHSFGVEIINQNRQFFFDGSERRPADELTQHQILGQIFDSLDWKHPLSKKNQDQYVYLKDTLRAISEFKKSGLSADELRLIVKHNQQTIEKLSDQISEVFADRVNKTTSEKLAPLAELAAEADTDQLPAGITPYANVLALSIAHAVQEAIETDSTKPITAWKNQWCRKDPTGKKTVLKDELSLEVLSASIDIYQRYVDELKNQNLFDYDDMILTVLEAIEHNPDLRANLQEQFQFIMVDEFQDTNLAQLRLLFNLTDGQTEPNIMVVGDDDQAIYSFQGADIGNIQRFRQKYQDTKIMVLTDNYRSGQSILEAARGVITQGSDRLETTIDDLSKELTAHLPTEGVKVELLSYPNPSSERANLAANIARLIEQGTAPENIAVLARQHNELIALLPYLAKQNIRVNYERHDNVLDQEVVKLMILISRAVLALSDNRLSDANAVLPELLSHPALGFKAIDIWKLSLKSARDKSLWLETMLANSSFEKFANWLIEAAKNVRHQTLEQQLDAFLELVHDYYFSHDKLAQQPDAYLTSLEALRTMRDKLREHFSTEQPSLKDFIDFVDLHISMNTRLATIRQQSNHQTGAVNLLSAHKAKGLEFEHVFIVGAVDNVWGEKTRSPSRLIRYPANLPLEPAGGNYDERLRLFFVAMTRAKKTLTISHAQTDTNGKDLMLASFLTTLDLASTTPDLAPTPDIASLVDQLETDWRSHVVEPMTTDLKQVLAPVIESYKLSATHLNNFIDITRGGPRQFLTNNLLRFPTAKSPAADFGTAIHKSLQFAHDKFKVDQQLPSQAQIIDFFQQQLTSYHLAKEDFDTYLERGQLALKAFLENKLDSFSVDQMTELDFKKQGSMVGPARLTGALDLVNIDQQQKTIFVTDYKTGKPSLDWKGKTDYEKIKLHKYQQQLMFYQLLSENSRDYSKYNFIGGKLQFVEPTDDGDIVSLDSNFTPEDLERFRRLIEVVWQKIVNLDLPDTSNYPQNYKGLLQFEQDLLDN